MIINPLAWWRQLLVTREMTEDEKPPSDEHADFDAHADDEAATPSKLEVGAWTGWGSMINDRAIDRDVKFAVSLGLKRLDVMVNDHAKARDPRSFDTYKKARIVDLCRTARGAGLQVHLTSWIMPHEPYLRGAAEQLLEIADSVGASSIMFDAEEPWTQARGSVSYEASSLLVSELFSRVLWGVTGIGYASAAKLGPLARRAAYIVPQCYSTKSSGLDPATAAPKLSERWRKLIAERELVVGLAAYRQSGIPGYGVTEAVRTAFRSAQATGTRDIVYWSLRHLRASPTISNTVRNLIANAQGASS